MLLIAPMIWNIYNAQQIIIHLFYLFIKRNSDKSNNNFRHAMSISSAPEASNIQYILWLLFSISIAVQL